MEISSLYTCVPQITIIWCMFPETWSVRSRIFCHFWQFFTLLPPNNPENQNFKKMKKTPEDIIILHMPTINENHKMYGSRNMKWDIQNLFILGHFVIFCPTNNPKNQNFEKMEKRPRDIIILHMLQKLWSHDEWFLRYGAHGRTDGWMKKVTHRGRCPT